MWDVIVLIPDHCLSFYSEAQGGNKKSSKLFPLVKKRQKNLAAKSFTLSITESSNQRLIWSFVVLEYLLFKASGEMVDMVMMDGLLGILCPFQLFSNISG